MTIIPRVVNLGPKVTVTVKNKFVTDCVESEKANYLSDHEEVESLVITRPAFTCDQPS